MMLAEASKPELLVKAFDIDYSWPLLATMNDVLMRSAPASKIRDSWEESRRHFPKMRCTCGFPTTTTKPAPSPATA